jgi:poly [ADP-ribose] polymerase
MKIIKLIQVSSDRNSNKFYNMVQTSDSEWKAEYGRVGITPQYKTYPMYQFDSMYRKKLEKGYVDVSDIQTIQQVSTYKDINDFDVAELIANLQSSSNTQFTNSYDISASSITEKQLKSAQNLLNEAVVLLDNGKNLTENLNKDINRVLTELYITIPRRMKKVSDYMLDSFVTGTNVMERALSILQTEQDILDSAQVTSQLSFVSNEETIFDRLGIDISVLLQNTDTWDQIYNLMGHDAHRIRKIFAINKPECENRYAQWNARDNNRNEELLFHGSRTSNILSIMSQSLLIRPSNAVYTGSLFGDGIYFANKAEKSINYTSVSGSYWARGSDNYGYLFVYEVARGKTLILDGDHKYVSYPPTDYDSVWAKKGYKYNYSPLRNDEIVIYNPNQCYPRYLIQIN